MKALLEKIRRILRDRRTRQFLARFVSGIAAIVVFVTTYALVLPAITMESEAQCGIEAHQHDDSCYSENLICGQEESEGHHHTEDCYTVTRNLICTIGEHQHSPENGCFAEDGSLICTLEEHAHADSCYEESRELTCGLEESEGHHHTDSCYEKVLTCGKEVHTHSPACYKADPEVEFSAVASTGMTSAAAEIEDDNAYEGSIVSQADEITEVSDSFSSESDKAGPDDRSESGNTFEDFIYAGDTDTNITDADDTDTNITDADDSADNRNKNNDDHKDTDEEGEEAASSFSTGFAADEDAENGDVYIPDKDALDFYTVLNGKTGIYYHHVEEDEDLEDSSAITDWTRADEDTELNPGDIIRVYLSYTLPKDTINATNDISRYRLPDALHLTDDQIEAINRCENGISLQYIDYGNLEITDPERHAAYLGLESVEGSRRPDQEPDEDSQEYISAVVRAEKIYDDDTGEYEGTDLIFTFSPYAVEKNAHAYDKKGQPTRAGEEVTGWLTLDFNMGQIDWAEDNTSEIIFAEEDQENDISEISIVLSQADPADAETDESAADGTAEAAAEYATEAAAEYATEEAAADATSSEIAAEDSTEAAAAETAAAAATSPETAAESSSEKTDADAETAKDPKDGKDEKDEITAANYPAAVFDDSITVRSGRLDTDLADTDLPRKSKMTVHVEADEGTFPEGTVMVLSAVEDLDAVAEAVGTAVDAKTRGFQAVDITFYDKDPSEEDAKEIEPLKPIRVSIKSDEIKKAAEDASTAPVVVHIEDDNTATEIENTASKTDNSAIEIEKPGVEEENTVPENGSKDKTDKADEGTGNSAQEDEKDKEAGEPAAQDHTDLTAGGEDKDEPEATITETGERPAEGNAGPASEDIEDSAEGVTGTNDDTTNDSTKSNDTANDDAADPAAENSADGVTGTNGGTADDAVDFEADSFSIYAVVYTVDFHWEVDGKTFDFSLPGGGFISLQALVETLGIVGKDVSDESKEFVEDVENVEFSNPELMWVGKVSRTSSVETIKENEKLEVQYSAELTEDQIDKINKTEVQAGDWALISMLPFESQETLTVTMKDQEVFMVQVTDAAYDGTVITNLNGATGALVNTTNQNAVLDTAQNSTTLRAIEANVSAGQVTTPDGSPELTQWTFNYVGNWNGNNYYTIRTGSGYLHLSGNGGDNGSATISTSAQNLIVQTRTRNGVQQIRIGGESNNHTYALNNVGNTTGNGYAGYGNWGWNDNPGEWFTVYALSYPDDPWELDGKDLAIINNRDGGSNWQALRDEIDGVKDSRGYYMSGNSTSYTVVDGVDYSSNRDIIWTFEFVSNDSTGSYYRIHAPHGYLYIDPNVTKKSDMPSNESHSYEHALRLESSAGDGSASDGTLIRVVANGDGTYLLQNRNGVCLWNYGNDQFWLSTLTQDGESETSMRNSRFRLTRRLETPHVTVHYVDRYGTVLTGVQYTGTNPDVIDNHNGTFTIPYNTSGNVDLREQFDFTKIGEDQQEYTYANTHLDGVNAAGTHLEHNGYVIDSALTASNGDLIFKSDSGETNAVYNPMTGQNIPKGNLEYGTLTNFSLSGAVQRRPRNDGGTSGILNYALAGNKDIYVVLDPLPTGTSGGGSGTVNPGDVKAPSLDKSMESNDDGTYTLSLKVDAHAKNAEDTNKANVLFVVDTSSSMRKETTNGKNRIMDTHDEVLNLGKKLLAYNNSHAGAVEVSMITFDGAVKERLDWTEDTDTFEDAVNEYLRYYYLHTGTDWEDGMNDALDKLLNDKDDHPTDNDPTFVIFFTDGEPSQYTNFHGSGTNGNADPTHTHTGATDPGEGYSDYYSYFLCRESAKDEMRAVVDAGASLYGIFAYNPPPQQQTPPQNPYNGYNGQEGGAEMLHNAIKYAYNASDSLENSLFYKAEDTEKLKGAFDAIFNLITEKVGFTNVVVKDGIATGVTSSTVVNGDVSGFTYMIRDNTGALAYKVTVAPNGVPEGTTAEDGKPLFWFSENGPPVVGEVRSVPTTKIYTDTNGDPILDENDEIQTVDVNVDVYYYKEDPDNPDSKEYIMPIATTGANVVWDLSPLGVLKDGYKYEVDFVVWPKQDAYDLVADLNNGKRTDLEEDANWDDKEILTDSDGKEYRIGGFEDYPYIARYEDGIYSAMSNTNQSVEFYKVDKKIEDGEEVTVYTRPDPVTVDPPGPMPLTASMSQIEKQWNVDRNPAVLTELLYGNKDPDSGEWIPFSITFGVYIDDPPEESTDDPNDPTDPTEEPTDPNDPTNQTDPTDPEDDQTVIEPYKSVTLGWQSDWDKETDDYEWLDAPEENNVTYGGKGHKVGTRWAQDFSIATGLMLSEEQMEIEGLKKSLYSSFEYDHVRYYILEPGHDYRLEESPKMGYEFDYSAPVYHPMLVDNVLRSVTFTRDTAGKITGISEMTSADVNMSSLKVENTLRGYINLKKVVVDKNNNPRPTDDTKFAYHISLVNPSPVFDGDHIPWYGVNDLYYHDDDFNYFHAYVDEHNQLKICTESGGRENPYDAVIGTIDSETEEFVAGGTFDPNNVTGQVLRFEDESGERIVTIKGNRTNAADDGRSSWADMMICQRELLSIANVPLGTKYTITETQTDGYALVSVVSNQSQNEKAEIEISGYEIEGNIIQNANNDITYTNKVIDGSLQITKNVTVDNEPTETDWADGEYSFVITDANGKPAIGMVNGQWIGEDGRVSITITNGESDSITVTGLRIGEYTITEDEPDNGTILAAFTVNGDSKTVENGVVADDDKKVMVLENQNTTATFTNNINTTAVEVQKVWTDDGQEGVDHTGQTISYKIYRIPYEMMDDPENEGVRIRGASYPVQEVTADLLPDLHNNGFTGILQYNSQNPGKSWKERVSKLPRAGKYIPAGETEAVQVFYEYYVTEETEIPGYKTSIDGSLITEGENQGTYSYIITNEPLGPTDQETLINVRKEWKTADGAADEDLHKTDSILLNVTQKKYEAKVLIGTGDQAEPKMLYPITINLSDKNGNNNNPRVNHTYVVYVPEGAEFTMEPHWVVNGSNPQEHTVYVYGNGITVTPRSQSPSTITYADKPGRTYYYPGATFTIEEVDSAKEITLELHAGNDKWMDLYDMYHSSEEPSYEDRHQWTCEMTSSYEIIWDLEEMLDNVLQGADGPAHTDPVLVNTSHPSYTMALTNNETGLPTVISNGENAPGHGEGSVDHTWEGSIRHLPLYEYKDSGDDAGKSFIYTYELTETAIGSDTVNTVNPPGEPGEWNGQTTSYLVKWDQDTQTGSWTLTNQKKPPTEITLYKVSEKDFPNTSSLLEGAAFKLIKYTSLSPKAKDMSWGNDGESAVVSDDPQNPGIFNFENLDAGYYEIVETTYPDGYVQITENPIFQVRYLKESAVPEIFLVYGSGEQIGQPITGNATDIVKIENGTVVFGNIPGAALPNSGGPGTKLFTILGAMLLVLAAAGMTFMKTGLKKRRL